MKCIDITSPVKHEWQRSLAKLAFSCTALLQYVDQHVGTVIPVTYEESVSYLGTTDGQSYHLNPARDEAINDWSEKH